MLANYHSFVGPPLTSNVSGCFCFGQLINPVSTEFKHWFLFSATPSFSQDKATTTTTVIDFTVSYLGSDPQMFRGNTLAFDGTSVLTTTGTLSDNGYVQNTPRSGLTPGTEYTYELTDSSPASTTVKMCTR